MGEFYKISLDVAYIIYYYYYYLRKFDSYKKLSLQFKISISVIDYEYI